MPSLVRDCFLAAFLSFSGPQTSRALLPIVRNAHTPKRIVAKESLLFAGAWSRRTRCSSSLALFPQWPRVSSRGLPFGQRFFPSPSLQFMEPLTCQFFTTASRNCNEHESSGTQSHLSNKGKGKNSSQRQKQRKKKESQQEGKQKLTRKDKITKLDYENFQIEEETRAWVKRVVVGLNLCPFAAPTLAKQQVYITVVRGVELEEILRQVLVQALVFAEEDLPGTALIVCPDLFPTDFDAYLDVVNMITEGLLEEYYLVGEVQVVPFHPLFVFGDGDGDDNEDEEVLESISGSNQQHQEDNQNNKIEFWTNRSPYPMFHVLKEQDVSHAIDLMKGDTDRVWQRNVQLLQKLEQESSTPKALQTYLTSGQDDEHQTLRPLIKRVLAELAEEFPLLARPIVDKEETKE
jgi:hypothetical protein